MNWETYPEVTNDSAERQRKVGGYIWRERLEDAQTLTLDVLVDLQEPNLPLRAKLRKVHDILHELEGYRGGGQ